MEIIRIESKNSSHVIAAPSREQAVAKGIELLGLTIDDISAEDALVAASQGAELVVVNDERQSSDNTSGASREASPALGDQDLASTMSQFGRS